MNLRALTGVFPRIEIFPLPGLRNPRRSFISVVLACAVRTEDGNEVIFIYFDCDIFENRFAIVGELYILKGNDRFSKLIVHRALP